MDQIRYTTKTHDHEFVDSEVIILLSRIYAFCEEGHAIMDCPFVPFHIRTCIVRHVELQNATGALMDQPHEQESRILVVHNRLKNMELGS